MQFLAVTAKEDSVGIGRQWFSEKRRLGFKILHEKGIKYQPGEGNNSEEKFLLDKQPEDIVYGDPAPYMQFLRQQVQKFQKKDQPQEEEEILNPTSDQICEIFLQGIKSGKYKSVKDLRTQYRDDAKTLRRISKENTALRDLVLQFIESRYQDLPYKDRIDTLKEFVEKYPLTSQDKPLNEEMLKTMRLDQIMEAIFEVVVQTRDLKLGTIILHGVPNSGKSSIMSIVNEIFLCDYLLQTQGNFDIVPVLKPYKFQVVLCEETDFKKMLKDAYINNTKLFFERKGRPLEGKGQGAFWIYQGAANILAAQCFDLDSLKPLEREAIETRCRIINLTKGHDRKEQFPLNSRQVAEWLLRRYREEEQLDEEIEYIINKEEDEKQGVGELSETEEIKPLHLNPPSLLGKRKVNHKSSLNSTKAEKRTRNEIEWNKQDTLNKFAVPQEEDEEEKGNEEVSLQKTYDEMKPKFRLYYSGKSFPYKLVYNIFMNSFREREFSYYTIKDNREYWKRQISFHNAEDLKETLTKEVPFAIYSGAIYESPVQAFESMKEVQPVATDLVFDIDIDDYDSFRTCGCQGKKICDQCWGEFIVPSVNIIDKVIRQDYQYKYLLWTFSGGRGAHLRVFDSLAQQLDSDYRSLILKAIKDEAQVQGFDIRLDEGVTKDLKRILRLPFSIHGSSNLLVVPFDPKEVSSFRVSEVPTFKQVAYDFKKVDKYTGVLKKVFFSQFSKSSILDHQRTFKSEERNPFNENNTSIEGSGFDDIWALIEPGINKYKSMIFWFQVRVGLCEYPERRELIVLFKIKKVPQERCLEFFQKTLPTEKFLDKDNKIPEQIDWYYRKYYK